MIKNKENLKIGVTSPIIQLYVKHNYRKRESKIRITARTPPRDSQFRANQRVPSTKHTEEHLVGDSACGKFRRKSQLNRRR